MKYIYIIFFLFLNSTIGIAQYSQNYTMSPNTFSLGSYSMFHFGYPGPMTGFQGRYNWRSGQQGGSSISVAFTFPKEKTDTFTSFGIPGTNPPKRLDSAVYRYKQFVFLYHYHLYILDTQNDDYYGYYLGGNIGITLFNYGNVTQLDRNRYKNTYQYRSGGYSIIGKVIFGTHYQFYSNLRFFAETGPYMYSDSELKVRGQVNNALRMGWNLTVGLELGI